MDTPITTPIIIPKLGIKRTLCISMFIPLLFVLGHFYSSFWTLIPAGMFAGVSMAVLYATQATYQTGMAYAYAMLTDQPINQVLPLFVAVYLTSIQCAAVVGNLISSTILKFLTPVFAAATENAQSGMSLVSNLTHRTQCGAGFCHEYLNTDSNNSDISTPVLYILLGYMAIMVVSGTVLAWCGMQRSMDQLFIKPQPVEGGCCLSGHVQGWLDLHKDVRMLCVLVLASFTSFMPSFIFSDSMKVSTATLFSPEFPLCKASLVLTEAGVTSPTCSFRDGEATSTCSNQLLRTKIISPFCGLK